MTTTHGADPERKERRRSSNTNRCRRGWWAAMLVLLRVMRRHPVLLENPVPFVISLGTFIVGVVLLAEPDGLLDMTSVGKVLPMWQEVAWAVMLVIGSVASVVGMLMPHRALDALGTTFVAATLIIDAIVIWENRGFRVGSLSGSLFMVVGIALLFRVCVLVWLSAVVRRAASMFEGDA